VADEVALGAPDAGTATVPTEARSPALSRRWLIAAAVAIVVAVAAFASRALIPQPRPQLTRLTTTSGLNTDPSLSGDGAFAVYASDRAGEGSLDIWVQAVGGGAPLRLTRTADDEAEPSFSPDGARIAFATRFSDTNAPGIYVVDALGGDPRLVVDVLSARNPRFSPSGKEIAYWTGFPPGVVAGGIPGALGKIFVADLETKAQRAIAPELAAGRYPVWSPDGKFVVFLGETGGEQTMDWYVAPIDGGAAVKTGAVDALKKAGIAGATPIPAAWTNLGEVLFASNQGDSSNVWMLPVAFATGRISGEPRRLTFGAASERSPAISASNRIAFASVTENIDVWRVPIDQETGVASGPPARVTDDVSSDRLRNLTADGRLLAFLSPRSKDDEVWTRDLESGRESQVTHVGAADSSISPDGSQLAFSTGKPGARHVEVLDTVRGARHTVCDGCDFTWDWSADGTRLLVGKGLPARLLVVDVASRRAAEETSHPSWGLFQARFSPKSDWIAFHTTNSPSSRQIYATPLSGGTPNDPRHWVPIITDHGCHPNWSSDGTRLYHFSVRDHTGFCPWVQQIDAASKRPIGIPRAVVHLHNPRLRAASGAAATNALRGGYFYFTATETTGNIWILEQ
jgi:Tol biopolymer transport system component